MLAYDVVVVGAGLAGLRAAIEAKRKSNVAIISKVHPLRSHTVAAQGGINAAISADDNWEKHALDTIIGSDYLADQDAVEVLCKEAPEAIFELDNWGALFSRTDDGKIAQRPFGGAGYPRTCYVADKTGHALLHTVYEQLLKENITVYEEWYATSLAVENGVCKGVIALNISTGELHAIKAKAVILATGGCGRVYCRSTNALINTGDGMAIAYRVGAPLKDMEFVQFHPTTLYGSNILISEAARGEGGYLINNKGQRFMEKYAPRQMELAPRDIVARAIETEINEGRGFEGKYVHLDLRHLGKDKINEKLPQVRELAINFAGIDPVEEPIPVQPGQHYSMGGISTDLSGATVIKGLYAAGECACVSVHGANRLGGNSLLETVVFGKRAGAVAAEYALKKSFNEFPKNALLEEEKKIAMLLNRKEGERVSSIKNEMQEIMDRNVGIFREKKSLKKAQQKIRELKERYKSLFIEDKGRVFNTELISALELGCMLDLAEVIVAGALAREESRGSHFRTDYPKRDDENWLKHTLVYYTKDGLALNYINVTITKFKPKERTY